MQIHIFQLPNTFILGTKKRSRGELNTIQAKIFYTFKGTVDVSGIFASDLQDKAAILIINTPMENVPPPLREKTETVFTFTALTIKYLIENTRTDNLTTARNLMTSET